MSSSEKTNYLHLNAWLSSDRPQRIDFVDDNTIIDNAIGQHISNATMHCTASEKAKLDNPYVILSYTGDGNETQTIDFNSVSPKFAIVFQKGALPIEIASNGITIVNQCLIAKNNGSSGGAYIEENTIVVRQSATAENNIRYNLNKDNGQYCVVAFK